MNDEALKAAYLAGFKASGEGYNGEYPFYDNDQNIEEDAAWCKDRDSAITAIKQARAAQPAPTVQEPVAINEVQKLSDGFIENPEAIKYLLDCLRWAQGEEGLPQTHYNFIRAFQRKGYAILQRLNEDYGPEWTFSKHATTPPAAHPAPVQGLPFGIGGGLVAIKTLLSRDPCVHANTAIEMIDAILKEHPATQHQCKWPTCQSEEYQQALAEQINQELVTGAAQPAPVPVEWMEMVAVNLLREGVNKHKARELAEHFYSLAPAQPAPVQEKPYAYANPYDLSADTAFRWCEINEYTMPVYTTPPAAQRQWVGLTDEEISEAYNAASKKALYRMGTTREDVYEAIEAKLKEKNT
jgi:hypothetical protein